MGKRFDAIVFPGGKQKVFTLSYDDGVIQDRRLAELFRSFGVKATFNLNSALLGKADMGGYPGKPELDISKLAPEELAAVYATHEIAGHSLYHSDLSSIGTPLASYEIIEDKRRLEALCGQPLRMFAYPFGTFNSSVKDALRLAGYQGARTIRSTHGFALPTDTLEWDPTCHHNDPQLMDLAREFVESALPFPMLFYVWGHGYEFDDDKNWSVMEELLRFLSPHASDIWFASNGEILEYLAAWQRLEYSSDGSLVRNPSAMDVWIRPGFGEALRLPGGTVTHVPETPL